MCICYGESWSHKHSKCNGYSKTKNEGTEKETANYTLDSIVMTKKKKEKQRGNQKKSDLRTLSSTKAQRTRVYKKKKKQPLFLFKEESWQLYQHSVHPYLSHCRFARFIDKLLSFFLFFTTSAC